MMRKLIWILAALLSVPALAGVQKGGGKTSDLPVTSTIADFDSNNVPYLVQSDGQGPYQNGVRGVQSVLQSTANYAWLMNTYDSSFTASSGRYAFITLGPANQQSTTATLPAFWTSWGTYLEPVRIITHGVSCPLLTIRPGSPIYCPLLLRFGPTITSGKTTTYYRLGMTHGAFNDPYNDPESQQVQVSCNAMNSSGSCNDWSIDSIPPEGGSNEVVAQLTKVTQQTGSLSYANQGDFYLTFHIRVTNP
jgi:hypothetical protein